MRTENLIHQLLNFFFFVYILFLTGTSNFKKNVGSGLYGCGFQIEKPNKKK